VAMIVPESVSHDAILQVIKKAKPKHLEEVQLFDIFRGKNFPSDHKSMAYAFIYRSDERTLTDAEVNQTHSSLVEEIKSKYQQLLGTHKHFTSRLHLLAYLKILFR
jgi:phenylalanyl-tRNA synthetase beta chain